MKKVLIINGHQNILIEMGIVVVAKGELTNKIIEKQQNFLKIMVLKLNIHILKRL